MNELDGETQLGLWLHLNRQMARNSLPTVMAIAAAVEPSKTWLEAIGLPPEQAESIQARADLLKQHYEVHNGGHNGF